MLKVTETDASPGRLAPALLLPREDHAIHRRGQRSFRSQVTSDILAGLTGLI